MDDLFENVPDEDLNSGDVDYHTELVGEGKKFRDDKELAKGKYHADKTIEALTKKLDELQQELKVKTSMEDFLTKIKPSEAIQPQNGQVVPDPNQNAGVQSFDDSTLEQKLEALIAKREANKQFGSNSEKVNQVMSETFGPDAKLVINKKARELGMSVKDLQDVALKSPTAFFNLIGVQDAPAQSQSTIIPRSGVNSVSGPSVGPVRNAAFYDKMRREDPARYFRGETTVQQIKDAEALGDRYYA